ncbi:MAG: class I SAM-dependent methyltransferase [Candidatus Sigynarchaeota archaeon]
MYAPTSLWHARFKQQLEWTSSTRDFVYRKLDFAGRSSFLELGCGTGALLEEIARRFVIPRLESGKIAHLVGIDNNQAFLERARAVLDQLSKNIELKHVDAQQLPFPDGSFDVVFCHYFLMWNQLQKRAAILKEARRVLRDGGWLVALAEPDYQGWILEPPLAIRGLLLDSLTRTGGDPASGRKLAADLAQFKSVTIDCCSSVLAGVACRSAIEADWAFYKDLLAGGQESKEYVNKLQEQDNELIESGSIFSFLPVFYAFGRK